MPTTRYVLWDNDATLVDSEIVAMAVAIDSLIREFKLEVNESKLPGTVTPEERAYLIQNWAGIHFADMVSMCEEKYGVLDPEDRKNLIDGHEEEVAVALETVKLVPGISEVFEDLLAPKYVHAVVTSSGLSRVDPGLDANDLRKFFVGADGREYIYSAKTLGINNKPHPDIYLYALEQLGITADQAVAIEDSTNGVKAAVAAGVPVIGWVAASHIPLADRATHAAKLTEAGATMIAETGIGLRSVIEYVFNSREINAPKFAPSAGL